MFILGAILFSVGLLSVIGTQLFILDSFFLLPSYILVAMGAVILVFLDWRRNKQNKRKLSGFALSCFIFGFLGLLLQSGPLWLLLGIGALSIICGIIFKVKQTHSKTVYNTFCLMGIIMGGVVFLLGLFFSSFKFLGISKRLTVGLDVESQVSFFKEENDLVFDAWVQGKKQIFKYNIQTSKTDQITFVGDNRAPAVSPLDNRIAFVSNRDGNEELYLMDANGSRQVRLTINTDEDGAPSFSADGKKITFQRIMKRPLTRRIFVMDLDSGEESQLMAYPYAGGYQDPLFFDDNTVWFETAGEIVLIDVMEKKEITRSLKIPQSYNPVFSFDRQNVAFVALTKPYRVDKQVAYEVFIANADGSNRRQITHNGNSNRPKAFSPNGQYVVFLSGKPSEWGNLTMWQVDINGDDLRQYGIKL